MRKVKLSKIPNSLEVKVQKGTVLLLKDSDGHSAFVFRDKDRLGLQFQEGFVPIAFPEMEYEIVGFVSTLEGLRALK